MTTPGALSPIPSVMVTASTLLATAVAHQHAGRFAEAAAICTQALTLTDAAPFHLQHALSLRSLRRPEEALAALARAIALEPTLAEAHHQTGLVLKSLGRLADALLSLRTAAHLAPDRATLWLNLAVAALDAEGRDEALAAVQRAVALEPARPEAHNLLGHTLAAVGRTTEAHAAYTEALRLRPNYAAARDNLGRLAKSAGLLDEAVVHFRAALALQPSPGTHSNLLLALNYLPDLPPAELFAEHRRWHTQHAALLSPAAPPLPSPTLGTRRLRVGYLSPDFNHHAVAYFIEPVLASHDRTRVEVFCYANVRAPDSFTARLRAHAEHWRDIAPLDDSAAADLIRRDALDVLIDLAGHTAHHRLHVLARRPAPAQATWIGYPNTTGLDAIDYRLTDAISDPIGQTEAFHSEKLVRLPTTFSCYRPDDTAPPVNALSATTPGAVTFGCFNNLAKLSPAVLGLWAELLRALPSSRLVLKSRGLDDPTVTARLYATFASHGITTGRLTLDGTERSVAAHLALYHSVDIALDPFPYNGTTTTCEALWMGVPVLTLAGQTHAARVGASLLTHTGLTEWIAATPADYVRLATAAAHDLPRLATLRATLRERLRTSPLCDARTFTRGLETALEAVAAKRA